MGEPADSGRRIAFCEAGVELGAMRHVMQVIERHDLGLGDAVNVDIGADAVFHSLVGKFLLQSVQVFCCVLHRCIVVWLNGLEVADQLAPLPNCES